MIIARQSSGPRGRLVCAVALIGTFFASLAHPAGLTGSSAPGPIVVNLTTTGTVDWKHWGLSNPASVNRKAGVTSQISGLTLLGAAPGWFGNDPIWNRHSWTDGTPTLSKANFSGGIYFSGIGNGYQFTVPADTTSRTLKLYVGGWNSTGGLRATLSDGSAAPYVTTFSGADVYSQIVTLTFSAASSGQLLTVRHTMQSGIGNVGVQAAALTQQAVGGNTAPTLSAIGNKTVVAGSPLAFTVTGNDPDGPAPLVMTLGASVPALPGAASYVDNGNGTGSFNWTPGAANVGSYQVTFVATDGGGLAAQQTITITVNNAILAAGGSLSGDAVVGPSSEDLSGTADWVDWGLSAATPVNRKSGVAPLISGLTLLGAAPARFASDPNWTKMTWTDGTPTTVKSDFSGGVYFVGIGNGYELSVPADAASRVLKLYVGGYSSTSEIRAALSDGSAAPFAVTFGNPGTVYRELVTLTFKAATGGQTLTVRHTMKNGGGTIGLQAATQPFPLLDDFNDGNFGGWTVINQSAGAANWQVVNSALRQLNPVESWRTFKQSYHLGTFAYLAGGLGLTDYEFSVIAQYQSQDLAEDIGVMFRYQDPNNYYRLTFNSRYGFTRLEKRVAGVFSALATNARGHFPDQVLSISVEVRGTLISSGVNGDPLFVVDDASLTSGTVALYTQDKASFDDVQINTTGATARVILHSPLAHSVDASDTLHAIAFATNVPAGGYVEFLTGGDAPRVDSIPPYDVLFTSAGPGDHQVAAVLRSQSGVELSRDTNVLVGRGGDYDVAVGDSITNGTGDFFRGDNVLVAPRIISFQGYAAPLTGALDTTSPVGGRALVFNEGVVGDDSAAAVSRIASIMRRHPLSNRVLILLGTNDAGGLIPSGAGCNGAACNGTFKGNMQTLIDNISWKDYPTNTIPSGVTPFVALVPPGWESSTPWTSDSNNLVRAYNGVIRSELVDRELGPDFFTYFMPTQTSNLRSLFVDDVHPNSLGHSAMSVLWHNTLRSANPLPLPFVLNGLGAASSLVPKQNLIESGDYCYLNSGFKVTAVPAVLAGGRWVIASNNDRLKTTSTYLTFSVDRPVTLYVGYDSAAAVLPGWMNGFANTGLTLTTTNAAAPALTLYSKSFPSGPIVLGANLQSPASGAKANYVAVVVEN